MTTIQAFQMTARDAPFNYTSYPAPAPQNGDVLVHIAIDWDTRRDAREFASAYDALIDLDPLFTQADQFGDVFRRDAFNGLQGVGLPLVAKAVVARHQSCRCVAAQERIPFYQKRLGAASRRRKSSDKSARAAPCHYNLEVADNRRFKFFTIRPRCFFFTCRHSSDSRQ